MLLECHLDGTLGCSAKTRSQISLRSTASRAYTFHHHTFWCWPWARSYAKSTPTVCNNVSPCWLEHCRWSILVIPVPEWYLELAQNGPDHHPPHPTQSLLKKRQCSFWTAVWRKQKSFAVLQETHTCIYISTWWWLLIRYVWRTLIENTSWLKVYNWVDSVLVYTITVDKGHGSWLWLWKYQILTKKSRWMSVIVK